LTWPLNIGLFDMLGCKGQLDIVQFLLLCFSSSSFNHLSAGKTRMHLIFHSKYYRTTYVFWLLLKVWRVGTLSLLWLLYCAHSFAKFTRGLLNVQGQGIHYSLWSKVRYYNLVTPHWKHLPFMHHLGRICCPGCTSYL
jgi:hypothetical protein